MPSMRGPTARAASAAEIVPGRDMGEIWARYGGDMGEMCDRYRVAEIVPNTN